MDVPQEELSYAAASLDWRCSVLVMQTVNDFTAARRVRLAGTWADVLLMRQSFYTVV